MLNQRLETRKLTQLKRKNQECRVFDLKINTSNLSKLEKEKLKMYFVEAKWLYNHILNQADIFKFDYKTKAVAKFNKDKILEEVELKYLPAKNRQDVWLGLVENIKNLSKAKKKGLSVGRLKFKEEVNSIELSQLNVTHYIHSKNKMKINGIKRPIRVFGLNQITEDMELANAKLLNLPDGYHIRLTTFSNKTIESHDHKESIGIDFGIKTNLTLSNGSLFNVSIPETERLKRLQRRFAKSLKGSKNRFKLKKLVAIEYQKMTNRKKDASNKIVNNLLTNYNQIVIQDENLKGWHSGWFGKQVQHSCMGSIKAKLILNPRTIVINRFLPTTKGCYQCGTINETITLADRVFKCSVCGLEEDRDVKAAKTILKIGTERIDFKPAEKSGVLASSMKQEAQIL